MKRVLQTGFLSCVVGWLGALAPAGAAAPLTLPFVNLGGYTTNQMTNYAASATPSSPMTSTGSRYYRGAFSASSAATRLAVQADDGADVYVNGVKIISKKGSGTHWPDLSGSLDILDYAFATGVDYCIEIDYQNNAYDPGDTDGVSLYAFNGGGSVRDGIALRGIDSVCAGGTAAWSACGDPPFTWSCSPPWLATVSGTGNDVTVSAWYEGTGTITATDSNGKSGTRALRVFRLQIEPIFSITCEGWTNWYILTNAEVSSGVAWNPAGAISANTRTNQMAFASPGTNILSAQWQGCTAYATTVVIRVQSATASTNWLCAGGQVVYSATTIPAGMESYVSWTGDASDGAGRYFTNTYATPGIKLATASCGPSSQTATVTVHKVNITNALEYALVGGSPAPFRLSDDSVGPYTWSVTPSGPGVNGSGTSVTVSGGSAPGAYTVKAEATPLPSCSDTSTLQVVQVAFSGGNMAFCEGMTSNLTFTVNPSSALSLLSFDTVTNLTTGGTNTHAHLTVSGTNLTVHGDVAGTAYLRAKLGNSVLTGPALQIVRVTFPSEPWYVGVGKDVTNTVTIVPTNAPVTFDTASASIATATAVAGGVKLTGVAPGTTQVRAKVGGSLVCGTKDVTAVRAAFPTNVLTICNGGNATFGALVEPPGAPVTFSVSDTNIVQLAIQGTNLTVTALTNGKAVVRAKIGAATFDEMLIKSVTITFPPNDWFALRGVQQTFEIQIPPDVAASDLVFTLANSNIASIVSAPPQVKITGWSNGTVQVNANIGAVQFCATKAVTIFSAQLQSIEFTSDHNLICNGTHITNAGTRFPDIEWNPGTGMNAPMTHTAGITNRIAATVALAVDGLPTGTVMALKGDSDEPALDCGATNSFSSGSNAYSIFVKGLSPLGKEIRTINESIAWSLELAGNVLLLTNSGPHMIFTTLGTPITSAPMLASIPTVPRMIEALPRLQAAIAYAGASPNAYTCYPRIVWHVVNEYKNYSLKNGTLQDDTAWELPFRAPRDCIAIARYARNVCMVMGIPGSFESPLFMAHYRTPTNLNRPNTALVGNLNMPLVTPGSQGPTVPPGLNTNWNLSLADINCRPYGNPSGAPGQVGGSGGLNAFEAAVVYTDLAGKKWYFPAGAGGARYDNPDGVIRLFTTMVWVAYADHDGNPDNDDELVVQAVEHTYIPLPSLQDAELCP